MNKLIEQIKIIQKQNPYMRTYLGALIGFVKRRDADLVEGMIYI